MRLRAVGGWADTLVTHRSLVCLAVFGESSRSEKIPGGKQSTTTSPDAHVDRDQRARSCGLVGDVGVFAAAVAPALRRLRGQPRRPRPQPRRSRPSLGLGAGHGLSLGLGGYRRHWGWDGDGRHWGWDGYGRHWGWGGDGCHWGWGGYGGHHGGHGWSPRRRRPSLRRPRRSLRRRRAASAGHRDGDAGLGQLQYRSSSRPGSVKPDEVAASDRPRGQ